MQPALQHPDLGNSNSDLEIPRLPHENIANLLSSPLRPPTLQRNQSSKTMSSLADDSSVDDSVSSVGADGWEAVEHLEVEDDSDFAQGRISRAATPALSTSHHTDLGESTVLAPDYSVVDANDGEVDMTPTVEKETDVSFLWDNTQITFPEDESLVQKERDVKCPLVTLGGKLAQSYVQDTTWAGENNLEGFLRMKMAPLTLSRDGPLRMFYCGPAEYQSEIEAKIGSAVLAGRSDSTSTQRRRRFIPVPASLDKDSPQIMPLADPGVRIEIDTLDAAERFPDIHETIKVDMASGDSFTSTYDRKIKEYVVDRLEWLPDIAVIMIPSNEKQDQTLRLRARQFLNRHAVPTMIVAANTQWETTGRPMTIDTRSPHLTVHVSGASMSSSESTILKRLPVDVDTFLQINSLQLNKSLACMLADAPAREYKKARSRNVLGLKLDGDDSLMTLVKAVSVLVFAILFFVGQDLTKAALSPALTDMMGPSLANVTHTITVSASATTAASSTTANSLAPLPEKALAAIPDVALKVNQSENFEAEILGDNIIIMRPPRWFSQGKKAPKVQFNLTRNGQQLVHEVTQLSEKNIFALTVPWESAYGIVDVQVTCFNHRGKKINNHATNVDFGSSYWKMLYWQSSKESPKESVHQKTTEPKSKADAHGDARDRLADDVQNLYQQVRKLGETLGQTVRDSLVSMHDTRVQVRKWKRESRLAMIDTIRERADDFVKDVNEYRRTHFREQQKDLLKLWWKVRGIPSREAEDKDRKHDQKARKALKGRKSR